jgi:MFS superfamily sulfate permease-like transporter
MPPRAASSPKPQRTPSSRSKKTPQRLGIGDGWGSDEIAARDWTGDAISNGTSTSQVQVKTTAALQPKAGSVTQIIPVTSIAAGVYTGLSSILDAAAFATIVLAPAGLPLDVGMQHALLGFIVTQSVVSYMSGAGTMLTPISYEVMPFLAKFAILIKGSVGEREILPTLLAGSMLVSVVAAVAFLVLSALPLGGVLDRLLPPPVQAGLFAAIGWGLYTLSYETLGFESSLGMPLHASFLTWEAAQLWLPAHILGIGLWLASRRSSSPALFPGFVMGVTLATHAVRLATATSLAEAQAGHWLMESTEGRPCTTLWESAYGQGGSVNWDALLSAPALKELVCALLLGPVVNTLVNLVLIGPVINAKLSLPAELRAHAAGTALAAVSGGYSNYIAVSNTAIHRKCGGRDRLSCFVAAAVATVFFIAHPLFVVVGYVPTLVVAAICVYIGADFLWDNLIDASLKGSAQSAAATFAVLAICLAKDTLWGVFIGVATTQLYRLVAPAPPAAKASKAKQGK